MPYVTSVERLAREEGMVEGLQRGIAALLKARYGAAGMKLVPKVKTVREVARLEELLKILGTADSLEKLRPLLK